MEMALVLLQQLIIMTIYIIVGYILVKVKMLTRPALEQMKNLVIYIVSPFLVMTCFDFETNTENIRLFFIAIIVSAAAYAFTIGISFIAKTGRNKKLQSVEQFGIIFSNVGFMGTPLSLDLLGKVGGFYNAAFGVPFNILNWTYGLVLMGTVEKKKSVKDYLKLFCTPAIICLLIGLIMYCFDWHFPYVVQTAITNIGNMTSPLAMIVCGAYLALGHPFSAFKKPRVWLICAFRLIVSPIITLALLYFLHLDRQLSLSILVAMATPMAAITIFFSSFDKEKQQVGMELFTLSTLLCIITMPVIVGIGSVIL